MFGVAATEDGGVVFAGFTKGDWIGVNANEDFEDFAAVKLDSEGDEVWRYQVRGEAPWFVLQHRVGDEQMAATKRLCSS